MEEQTTNTDWLKKEAEELKENAFDEDRLPALILEENKMVNIEIDFSVPFDKWTDPENGNLKKIIPVTVNDEKLVWWLNVKNPVYGQLVQKGTQGQTKFKILQTGTKQNTRYTIVEDEDETETKEVEKVTPEKVE